jgi:hypothetical protein
LRAYRNLVLDLLEEFLEYNLTMIPRGENQIADALATSSLVFKIPFFLIKGMKSRSSIGQLSLITDPDYFRHEMRAEI